MRSKYTDELTTCVSVYGDNWQALYAAAECAYIIEHNGKLPEWGCFIESVEKVNGHYIFVHKDSAKVL